MKAIKNIFLAITFLVLVVGCGGGGGGGSDSDDHDDYVAYLEVVNSDASDSNICNIYIVPSTSEYWEEDLLSGTLAPGYYETFYTDDCNRHHAVKVVFCDGIEDVEEVYLGCDTTSTRIFKNW